MSNNVLNRFVERQARIIGESEGRPMKNNANIEILTDNGMAIRNGKGFRLIEAG